MWQVKTINLKSIFSLEKDLDPLWNGSALNGNKKKQFGCQTNNLKAHKIYWIKMITGKSTVASAQFEMPGFIQETNDIDFAEHNMLMGILKTLSLSAVVHFINCTIQTSVEFIHIVIVCCKHLKNFCYERTQNRI